MKPAPPPDLTLWKFGELVRSAESELTSARHETTDALILIERAFVRVWAAGRCCVELKSRLDDPDKWPAFAKSKVDAIYPRVARCMRLARMRDDEPPFRAPSARFKELMILTGREQAPKPTPRRPVEGAATALRELALRVKRWWSSGRALQELSGADLKDALRTADKLEEIVTALREHAATAQKNRLAGAGANGRNGTHAGVR